jgi:signal transduction histidine kinase
VQAPAIPEDEKERLEVLAAFDILDTSPEERFDDLAQLAAALCDRSSALVTFVDEDRQWTKACASWTRDSVDRELSFCGHVIADPSEPLVVEDTLEDERFADNPLVTGEPGLRFYAGVPIVTGNGHAIGTVCVLDTEPGTLNEEQIAGLETIADQVLLHLQERREQERLVEESRFLQNVIDSLTQHVAIIDETGDIVATNAAWDDFAEERGGTPGPGPNYLRAAQVPDDEVMNETQQALEELLAGDRDVYETTYPCHEPGNKQWFRMTATAFTEAGRRRVVVAHRDVTAVKEAEAGREALIGRLSERDQMLERLGRVLPQALWIVDPNLETFDFLGERTSEFWRVDHDELADQPLAWLDRLVEEDRRNCEAWMEESLASFRAGERETARFEFRYRLPGEDGTRRGRIHAIPIHKDGQLAQIAGITEDLTDARRRQEREQRLAREEARVEELEQLTFATSHTLKTEVRRIHSFGQLLEKRVDERDLDGLAEPLAEILGGAHRLSDLHDALHEYAQVTRGGEDRQPVDLDRLLREVVAERKAELHAEPTDPDVTELGTVEGDLKQLRRLFAEIVDNAVKFTDEDTASLRVRGERTGDGVRIEIEDDGPGCDPAYADKMFEIFQQLDPGAQEGVGIGLTIARRIVGNHDGSITAEPALGEGTRIVIELPTDRDGA